MSYISVLKSRQDGQTLLIVVLVMVVALTVGLSIVLRSITNIRIATEEESSGRAFSAAEAGIEQALKTGTGFSDTVFDNNASIKEVTVSSLGGSIFLVNSGNPVEKDDGSDIWLIDHNTDGSLNYSSGWQQINGNSPLTIYWGSSIDGCTNAAMEIIVVSGTKDAPILERFVRDPCAARRAQNNFEEPTAEYKQVGGKNFYFQETIDIKNNSKGILVRLIPVYYSTPVAVKGCHKVIDPPNASCHDLPSQGKIIESTGISSGAVRKVTFFQGYSKIPVEFFQHGLFSTN